MSSLLEEAIVDAKALKEAALKNAETAVLEKYARDVKSALNTLLEQEEDPMDMGELGGDLDIGLGAGAGAPPQAARRAAGPSPVAA